VPDSSGPLHNTLNIHHQDMVSGNISFSPANAQFRNMEDLNTFTSFPISQTDTFFD
jgi:hypothetical protein